MSDGPERTSATRSRIPAPEPDRLPVEDFLLARIAEDEATARAGQKEIDALHEVVTHWGVNPNPESMLGLSGDPEGYVTAAPSRVLADCEARREIVAEYVDWDGSAPDSIGGVVRYLAAVYSDHPDYDERWRRD